MHEPTALGEHFGPKATSGRCVPTARSRRLPEDWRACYAYRPVLLETFVEKTRFQGICYQVANWRHLGKAQVRGKVDTRSSRKSHKKILELSARTRLTAATLHA